MNKPTEYTRYHHEEAYRQYALQFASAGLEPDEIHRRVIIILRFEEAYGETRFREALDEWRNSTLPKPTSSP